MKNHKEHYQSRRASSPAGLALHLGNSLLRISCEVSLAVMFLMVLLTIPHTVSAHEVYVLNGQEIALAVTEASPNPFTAIPGQEKLFLFYGCAIGFGVLVLLFASISPFLERICDPLLSGLKKWAPFVGRLTLGVSLFASGYFGAMFGPELPLSQLFSGGAEHAMQIVLMAAGVLLVFGALTRVISLLGMILFAMLVARDHAYMLTYVSYLGEFILFIILGGGAWSLDRHIGAFRWLDQRFKTARELLEKYSFFIMRVLFGIAVFYSSFYAKFLHSNLALETVNDYHLTNYFHFTPLFLVLGAFLVEAVIGLFVALGIELRFMAIVFTFFLTLSIMFFGEAVWPHLILFGVNLVIFCHGYDRYTLEAKFLQRKREGEPVF